MSITLIIRISDTSNFINFSVSFSHSHFIHTPSSVRKKPSPRIEPHPITVRQQPSFFCKDVEKTPFYACLFTLFFSIYRAPTIKKPPRLGSRPPCSFSCKCNCLRFFREDVSIAHLPCARLRIIPSFLRSSKSPSPFISS